MFLLIICILSESGKEGDVAVGLATLREDAPARASGAGLCCTNAGSLLVLGREAGPCLTGGVQCDPKHIKDERTDPPVAISWLKGR